MKRVEQEQLDLSQEFGGLRLLTVREVAALLRVHQAAVYEMCSHRKIPHLRVGAGRGVIRFREAELTKFIEEAAVPVEGQPKAPQPPPVKLKHLKI